MSVAPDTEDLKVRRSAAGRPTAQCFVGLSHPCASEHPVRPFANNIDNVISGLKERVFFINANGDVRPEFTADPAPLFQLSVALSKLVAPARVSWEHFVSTRPGSKRKLYEEALRQLKEEPFDLRDLAETHLFTKFERTWWTKPQVPRIINPRDPRYHILLGSYIHGVEQPIFTALQHLLNQEVPCIAKGHTQEDKAEHIRALLKPGWKCVGLDASRFDQCIGAELLGVEHAVYSGIYAGDRELARLLKCQLKNRGLYRGRDGKVRASMGAIRCSGDVNTSLGNCIISVLLAHQYCVERSIAHKVYCDGDDLLLFVHRGQSLDDLPAWYLARGLRMKVEPPAYTVEHVEFCQSKVVWCSNRWTLVRAPKKCLTTDYTGYLQCKSTRVWEHVVHATASCGLSLFSGCPVLQEWYLWGLRNGRDHGLKLNRGMGVADYYQRVVRTVKRKSQPISDAARASFSEAFGITPCQQLQIEETIRNMQCCAGFMLNKDVNITGLNTLV